MNQVSPSLAIVRTRWFWKIYSATRPCSPPLSFPQFPGRCSLYDQSERFFRSRTHVPVSSSSPLLVASEFTEEVCERRPVAARSHDRELCSAHRSHAPVTSRKPDQKAPRVHWSIWTDHLWRPSGTALAPARRGPGVSLTNLMRDSAEGVAVRRLGRQPARMTRRKRDTRAILRTIEQSEERSPLFWWMVEHHDDMVQASTGTRIRWAAFCAEAARKGLTDTRGRPRPNGTRVRLGCRRVRQLRLEGPSWKRHRQSRSTRRARRRGGCLLGSRRRSPPVIRRSRGSAPLARGLKRARAPAWCRALPRHLRSRGQAHCNESGRFEQLRSEACIDVSVAVQWIAPAEEPVTVHGADLPTPCFASRPGVGEARALRHLELCDHLGTGALSRDDKLVAEFGASVDPDVAWPHWLSTQIVNGRCHVRYPYS